MQLSKKKKNVFVKFCLHFSHVVQILNISKNNMTLIAYDFSKIRTAENGYINV